MCQRVILVELNIRKGGIAIESFSTCSCLDSTWSWHIEIELIYLRLWWSFLIEMMLSFCLFQFDFPDSSWYDAGNRFGLKWDRWFWKNCSGFHSSGQYSKFDACGLHKNCIFLKTPHLKASTILEIIIAPRNSDNLFNFLFSVLRILLNFIIRSVTEIIYLSRNVTLIFACQLSIVDFNFGLSIVPKTLWNSAFKFMSKEFGFGNFETWHHPELWPRQWPVRWPVRWPRQWPRQWPRHNMRNSSNDATDHTNLPRPVFNIRDNIIIPPHFIKPPINTQRPLQIIDNRSLLTHHKHNWLI